MLHTQSFAEQSNQEILIAAGSIALPDNTISNVAQYSLPNATWLAVGTGSEIPGPVQAVEVNNGNSSSVFAAGKTTDGTSFLSFWNGAKWVTLGTIFFCENVSLPDGIFRIDFLFGHDCCKLENGSVVKHASC